MIVLKLSQNLPDGLSSGREIKQLMRLNHRRYLSLPKLLKKKKNIYIYLEKVFPAKAPRTVCLDKSEPLPFFLLS